MKNHKKIPLTILLLLFILNSCLSIKPATTKSGKKYFETFFVGEEGTQYFIKPILFKNKDLNEELLLDISFRYRNKIKDSAIVNISIKSPAILKTIDSLKISNDQVTIKSHKVQLLFNEKNKKNFTSRFSTKISLTEIKELFINNEWEVKVQSENKQTEYKPNIRAIKSINAIKDNVFILM